MSHTILITGANGFVGSHILEALMQIKHAGLEIIVACRDRRKLLPDYKGEVRTGDLRDPVYLDHVLAGVDIVCHAAGWNSLWSYKKESSKLYLQPSLRLIDKAVEWKVKRFVNPGSVYAATEKNASPHDPGKQRAYWPQLNHMIEIENYMRNHCHLGCAMVNLRLGVFAGKRQNFSLLPVLANKLKKRSLALTSNGKALLPVIDGKDIGQAFVRAALAPQQLAYESFNVVGPEIPAIKTVMNYLNEEFNYPKPCYKLPWQLLYTMATLSETLALATSREPLLTRSMVLMMRGSHVNNERATEIIGYEPEVHWKKSVQYMVEELTDFTGYKSRLLRASKNIDL